MSTTWFLSLTIKQVTILNGTSSKSKTLEKTKSIASTFWTLKNQIPYTNRVWNLSFTPLKEPYPVKQAGIAQEAQFVTSKIPIRTKKERLILPSVLTSNLTIILTMCLSVTLILTDILMLKCWLTRFKSVIVIEYGSHSCAKVLRRMILMPWLSRILIRVKMNLLNENVSLLQVEFIQVSHSQVSLLKEWSSF